MSEKELEILRTAVANYMSSEGCECCEDVDSHENHKRILAELLNVPAYDDNSGYDFWKFISAEEKQHVNS